MAARLRGPTGASGLLVALLFEHHWEDDKCRKSKHDPDAQPDSFEVFPRKHMTLPRNDGTRMQTPSLTCTQVTESAKSLCHHEPPLPGRKPYLDANAGGRCHNFVSERSCQAGQ